MFFWIVIFPSLLFIGICVLITFGMISDYKINNNRIDEGRQKAARLKADGYKYVVVAPSGASIGLHTEKREIYLDNTKRKYRFSYETIRTVTLTPVSETRSETTGQTKTNRGNQIVSAALGGAVAGPVGALVGGLSGNKTSRSVTTEYKSIINYELEIQLIDEDMPRIVLNSGNSFGIDEQFKDMAVRLANIIYKNDVPR